MKKYLIFIVIILNLFSCGNKNKYIIRGYPNNYLTDSIVKYKLEDFGNIKNLLDSLDNIHSVKLSFKDSIFIKSIYPKVLYKSSCIAIPCYKEKNTISIDKFYIKKHNKKYPFNKLTQLFKKDFLNNGNPIYCSNPNRLGVLINIKDSNIKLLKQQFSAVTRAYDSLNINYSLNIELREFVKPPPPPPMLKDN